MSRNDGTYDVEVPDYWDKRLSVSDNFRKQAMLAWEWLEEARNNSNPDIALIERLDAMILRYSALATMGYTRSQARKL